MCPVLPVTVASIAGFLFFLICGALLTYSLFLLPHLLVFWTTATNGIADLTAAVWDFNNMPQLIYGKWMQRIGTFLLPVFVITNFPAMHKYIWVPAAWVIWHKFKALFMKKPYSMYENKIVRDYRDGKVTKEQLDRCSTCDQNAKVNDGLSAASRAQLAHQTGEEIVDADIARQTVEQKKQQ